MYATFNDHTLAAFADELEKIGGLDKEAILGLSKLLKPGWQQAAKMGTEEIAKLTGGAGLGAMRGAGRAGQAALKHTAPVSQAARSGLSAPKLVKGLG